MRKGIIDRTPLLKLSGETPGCPECFLSGDLKACLIPCLAVAIY